MKRKSRNALLFLFAGLVLAVAAVQLGVFDLSVISDTLGEEGYELYDPLLTAGNYDAEKFVASNAYATITASDGSIAIQGLEWDNTLSSTTDLYARYFENGCWHNLQSNAPLHCPSVSLKTENLYLVDFKTDYSAKNGYNQRSHVCVDESTINGVNVGGSNAYYPSFCSKSGSFELKWDDYEAGHYQLFLDGQMVKDGFAEGETFYLVFSAVSREADAAAGYVKLTNPRVRPVFDCDPADGVVKANACFAGPMVLTIDDLEGFESFCPSLESTHSVGGVVTQSNRVYYALAAGEAVVLADANDVWEFEYLADASKVGFPTSGTGVVNLCVEEFIPVENLFDYQESFFTADGQDSISFRATFDDRRVTSNGAELLTVNKPEYACQSSDGHDSRGDVFYYPEPSESCWSQNSDYDSGFFVVERNGMGAALEYDEEHLDGWIDVRDWWVSGELTLTRKPFSVVRVVRQESYEVGEAPSLSLVINNNYGGSLAARVLFVVQPERIDDETVFTEDVVLRSGENTVVFDGLPTRSLGAHSAYVKVFLATNKGVFDGSATKLFSYEVVEVAEVEESVVEEAVVSPPDDSVVEEVVEEAVESVVTAPETSSSETFWERFINWIKNLFKQ